MEKLKQYKPIILIALVVLGFAFYWYSYRPMKIVENCTNGARERAYDEEFYINQNESRLDYENFYQRCIRENGLK